MSDLSTSFPWLADVRQSMADRDRRDSERVGQAIHVCLGRHCQRRGGRHLVVAFEDAVAEAQLDDCPVVRVGCRDRCDDAPSVDIYPGPARYNHLTTADAFRLVAALAAGSDDPNVEPDLPASRPPWERDRVLSNRERRRLSRRSSVDDPSVDR
ncbi:MAG TPA: (2Fe-2S) ferredoxin domain-containing protein [Thermomicrobiales bacterium]|jgi:(2Fe-2S) ferredoxin|nr:(2Fe-2S) ferredoxin domain-containing protein [Thermomicrobiales bacterium]